MALTDYAILKTLAYSDIFDFPLTKEEIWKFLISDKSIQRRLFEDSLKDLVGKQVSSKYGYFFLMGREKIAEKRKTNLQEVEKKLQIARRAVSYLSHIPSVLFIGLSGGLAMNDADSSDDVDLFIITKKNKLFQTRFWILMILQTVGLRRTKKDKNPKDKICVNFLIDETKLSFPVEKRDIYIAHEIAQIKPLFEREEIYKKFLKTNTWIKKFLPNIVTQNLGKEIKRESKFNKITSSIISTLPLETVLRTLQLAYMRNPKNKEMITNSSLVFHPNDYRVQILKQMKLKFHELGLLTKN